MRSILLTALALRLMAGPMLAEAAVAAPSSCAPAAGAWAGVRPLGGVLAALARDRHLRIVAMGSSSTQGTGASRPERSYPAMLERLLDARFGKGAVEVINSGVGGETVADNLARFGRDVIALDPDLVIWQVGTNDALEGVPAAVLRDQVLAGIAQVRAAGAEIVLMDPQPLRWAEKDRVIQSVQPALAEAARRAGVPLLPRHRLMTAWLASGQFTPATLLGPDGVHMTDASYRCLAERVADLLPATATEATAPRTGGGAPAQRP